MDFFHALTKDAARKPGRELGAKPVILVTGADGQLGNELRDLAARLYAISIQLHDQRKSLPIMTKKEWCVIILMSSVLNTVSIVRLIPQLIKPKILPKGIMCLESMQMP